MVKMWSLKEWKWGEMAPVKHGPFVHVDVKPQYCVGLKARHAIGSVVIWGAELPGQFRKHPSYDPDANVCTLPPGVIVMDRMRMSRFRGLMRCVPMMMLWRKRAAETCFHPTRMCFSDVPLELTNIEN